MSDQDRPHSQRTTLSLEERTKLGVIAARRGLSDADIIRQLIREEHARVVAATVAVSFQLMIGGWQGPPDRIFIKALDDITKHTCWGLAPSIKRLLEERLKHLLEARPLGTSPVINGALIKEPLTKAIIAAVGLGVVVTVSLDRKDAETQVSEPWEIIYVE